MKKELLIVFMAAFLIGSLFGDLAAAQDNLTATTPTDDTLNVRTGPSVDYGVAGVLEPGSEVYAVERTIRNWARIYTPDRSIEGWVNAYYLTFEEGTGVYDLPVSNQFAEDVATSDEGGLMTAYTTARLNMRQGPGGVYDVLLTLPISAPLFLEAQDSSGSWVLATQDGTGARGWVAAYYLKFAAGGDANLPVSEEIVGELPPDFYGSLTDEGEDAEDADSEEGTSAQEAAEAGGVDDQETTVDGPKIPIIPNVNASMRRVYLKGQEMGNRANVFSKVGDCMTAFWRFMLPFGTGEYNLGPYQNLEPVIKFFNGSPRAGVLNPYENESMAAHNGFNSGAVLDPQWANPNFCKEGESPLVCEYRISKPSVAIIMFGASDIYAMDADQYTANMERIIEITLDRGIIPLLSTFPGQQGFLAERAAYYNYILVGIAQRYKVPIMNLWLPLQDLPNNGLEEDGLHLTWTDATREIRLTEAGLQYGYNMRNLVTMQALDKVWRSVMQ